MWGIVVRRLGFFLVAVSVAMATAITGPAVAAEPGCRDGVVDELVSESCESATDGREPEVEGVDRLNKSADRKTYQPGDTITFTIEISASDSGTATDNFDVFDKMDDVLDDATYNGDATATEGSAELQPVDGSQILRWRGQLDPGESATLTFSVTADAKGDKQIKNFALHAAHNGSECGFSRSHGPPPGDIDFDDVPGPCKVTVPPGDTPDDDESGDSAPTPVADTGPSLPTTGTSLDTYIAVAAALLIIGAVLLVVARRRRSRPAETE